MGPDDQHRARTPASRSHRDALLLVAAEQGPDASLIGDRYIESRQGREQVFAPSDPPLLRLPAEAAGV